MNAPAPTPAEQATIDRFGIFAEERVIEEVARAIWEEDDGDIRWVAIAPDSHLRVLYRRLAVAAVAAYRATQDGGA